MANKGKKHRYSSVVVLLLAALVFLQISNFHCGSNYEDSVINDSEVLAEPLNDSLPYYQYKRLSDSINYLKQYQKSKERGIGTSMQFGPVGYSKYSTCDTCSSPEVDKESVRKINHYFILTGYRLDYNSDISVANGKSILKYPVWDSMINDIWTGHYEKKRLNIGFKNNSLKKSESQLHKYGSVLIPVSKTGYTLISVLLTILSIAGIIFSIYILIYLPFAILVAIATGAIFTKINIRNLLIMGWSLILIFFALPITGLLFNLIFSSVIPKEIVFPFWESLLNNKTLLIAGVIILLLANAFKRGYKLQQEQDLTV